MSDSHAVHHDAIFMIKKSRMTQHKEEKYPEQISPLPHIKIKWFLFNPG